MEAESGRLLPGDIGVLAVVSDQAGIADVPALPEYVTWQVSA
ncbi:hypothetical protein [Haloarchaeobius sp. TZWSO28]